ncbi:hypothetical protein BHE74_00054867 [Ensete ventricosum]|nr:hypothetical protein BHE74_00054867 [Ensete ventricosum]RZS19122.1 hypothetical protein BHM03_00051466 [Ensete ventricosum]
MECKNTWGIYRPQVASNFWSQKSNVSEKFGYERFSRRPGRLSRPNTWVRAVYPPALGESIAQSIQIPGYGQFNHPDWAGQPSLAARKPGWRRYTRRSPMVYPLEFPQKWFPPLFEFQLEPDVDQPFGQPVELNLSSIKPQ